MQLSMGYRILEEIYDKSINPTWDDWQKITKLKSCKSINNTYKQIEILIQSGFLLSRKNGCLEIQLTYEGADIVKEIKKIKKIEEKALAFRLNHFQHKHDVNNHDCKHNQAGSQTV